MSAETDPRNDPLHPLALNARIGALEDATYLALSILFKDRPNALDDFEDLVAEITPPDETNDKRKAFERMVKAIRQYHGAIAERDRERRGG
ncbi:hypothetical protein O3U67_14145 [Brevundimonas diminuta]|uniref:hypothetical protein n=1 Tax=Brevundimonas diminuta TaxID=293 RepID=UPI0022AFD257|nr:hypothetical protein [Brevundimonas diminuta]MCZ4109233.1 hypothetical protein [Brevundimonas diminuta]